MTWPDYLPSLRQGDGVLLPEDVEAARRYGAEISTASEPGPVIEIRDLFRRLFGNPQDCQPPSPYTAGCHRLRARLRPTGDHRRKDVIASIEFRCWPMLRLGYVENVHVGAGTRRRGNGARLLNLAVDHLRRKGCDAVYAYTVSQEGFRLFESGGFTAELPKDAETPWRSWVRLTTSQGQGAPDPGRK